MDLSIVIPYRPHPDRDRIYTWVHRRITGLMPDVELIVGDDFDRGLPFNRARACNDGIAKSKNEYVLIGDADIVYDGDAVHRAVDLLDKGASWVIGYTLKWHLSEETTEQLLRSSPALTITNLMKSKFTTDPIYPPPAAGGTSSCVLIRREIFPEIRFDERFVGWGYEDQAFATVCTTLLGPYLRTPDDCLHLWHPYVGNDPNPYRAASDVLWERYRAAEGDVEAVGVLLKEAP